jgi:hypothetical protein
MNAKTSLALALALALVLPAPAALAQARRPADAASVADLLRAFERVPTAADWQQAGPPQAVAAELMRLADAAPHPVTRGRALASLAHFPTLPVRRFLTAKVTAAPLDVALRGKAAFALARGFGESALGTVAPLLAERSPRLREDAVRALATLAAPAVEQLLDARQSAEPAPHIREAMQRAASRVARNRATLQAHKRQVPVAPAIAPIGPVPAAAGP